MPHPACMREQPESPASACSRRIRLRTSSARCGRSDTMHPTYSTQPTQLLSTRRAQEEDYAPALVRIPAGWFLMGCATGQDNEKPVHRVWVDEFLLASRQVTNADYV